MLGYHSFSFLSISTVLRPITAVIRPGRILLLGPDTRTLLLGRESRAILLGPDIRALFLYSDEEPMSVTTVQQWSPAASDDADWYWLSLSLWIPPVDTILTPAVSVIPIVGDINPLMVVGGTVTAETGVRTVIIPPGVVYDDPGPRIRAKLTGGTVGNLYTTIISWADSQGRIINRQAQLLVQW